MAAGRPGQCSSSCGGDAGPSLALTPVPTAVPGALAPRGNVRHVVAPGKRRLRSFDPHSRKLSMSSTERSPGPPPGAADGDGMLDVSLEEEAP